MSRTKGSKNKKAEEVVTSEPVKRKRRTKAEMLLAQQPKIAAVPVEEDTSIDVVMFDLESFQTIKTKKAGLAIKTKKTEFAVLADSLSKTIELKFSLVGIHNGDINGFAKKKFDITLTPDMMRNLLDYIRETPRDKIEKNLKKLKDAISKSDKDADL